MIHHHLIIPYPFGHALRGTNPIQPNPDYHYAYNGKEKIGGTGLYAYGFRYYDPLTARFTGVDPISDQFAFVSVYNYAENSPVRYIDLHGLQALRITSPRGSSIRGYDIPSWRKHIIEATTFAQYPSAGSRIGDGEKPFSTKLAKTVSRFARHARETGAFTSRRGGGENALRHTLLNASITREFDAETATIFSNAHEGVGPHADLTVDWSIPFEGNRDYADAIADVMNNEIGRMIGEANPNADIREMAVLVAIEFHANGLYMVFGDEESGFRIEKTKITDKQLKTVTSHILSLDENGFSSEEAKLKRQMDEN